MLSALTASCTHPACRLQQYMLPVTTVAAKAYRSCSLQRSWRHCRRYIVLPFQRKKGCCTRAAKSLRHWPYTQQSNMEPLSKLPGVKIWHQGTATTLHWPLATPGKSGQGPQAKQTGDVGAGLKGRTCSGNIPRLERKSAWAWAPHHCLQKLTP